MSGLFTEVTPPAVDIATIEYREGGGGPAARVLPGRVVYRPARLLWGLGLSQEMWTWLTEAMAGKPAYRDVAVISLDNEGTNPTARYEMRRCLPSAWSMSDLDASGHRFAIESMELRYEQLVRVLSPPQRAGA